jgi:uncharacterized protein with HEPN domain
MPPTAEDRLRDILEAIAEIDKMLISYQLEQFTADKMRRMATERYLEVVVRRRDGFLMISNRMNQISIGEK